MSSRRSDSPNIRLAFGSFLWRSFLIIATLVTLFVWTQILRMGVPVNQKIAFAIFVIPKVLSNSFMIAAVITVLTDLCVRFGLKPMYVRWQTPAVDASASSFHLDVREAILASSPARRRSGRLWRTGTLVRTDRRIWFFPQSWDLEAWSEPVGAVAEIETVEAPRMFLGFVRGLPDHLRIETFDEAVELFVVPDPDRVRSEFCPKEASLVSWIS